MNELPPRPETFDIVTLLRTLYAFVQQLTVRVAALEAQARPQPAPAPARKTDKPQPVA